MSRENIDTRTKILETTWRLMEAQRGQGVRMSDIAKATGISRQAIYLHFAARADLLIATTRHMDMVMDVEERIAPSREAKTGVERLDAFIAFWGEYLPEIHGVASALLSMRESDDAAASAWDDRMRAVREGCEAAIMALHRDGQLAKDWSVGTGTDMLWTMLSVQSWIQLTTECGWTPKQYVERMRCQARLTFVTVGTRRKRRTRF